MIPAHLMRVAFVDLGNLDYTAITPKQRPLGGMQSATCYLATALAARRHGVALINRTTTPGLYGGVDCAGVGTMSAASLNGFDAVISISPGSTKLRHIGVTRPLILWTGHDVDRPAVESLREGAERFLWDKYVLVSDWQSARYSARFNIKPERISVLRNAIAPAFERSVRGRPYFFVSGRRPVLIYSSTPFRGLDVLLSAFPRIRARVPRCEATICSSMAVYQAPLELDSYRSLYDLCRATEGIHYMGSIGQDALAQTVSEADIFAYPSTFAETSCIALMEAMASGCLVVASKLGALPETAAGFGSFCERPADPRRFAEFYADFMVQTIHDAYKNPERWAARIDDQRAFALNNYVWSRRAVEWEEMLTAVSRQPVRSKVPPRSEPCPCRSGRSFEHCCGAIV